MEFQTNQTATGSFYRVMQILSAVEAFLSVSFYLSSTFRFELSWTTERTGIGWRESPFHQFFQFMFDFLDYCGKIRMFLIQCIHPIFVCRLSDYIF